MVVAYQSPVFIAMGAALLIPLLLAVWDNRGLPSLREFQGFLVPALISLMLGLVTRFRRPAFARLRQSEALLVTTAAWLTTGVLGAIPFILVLKLPVVDALLESVSGFTTAGTTMLTGLDTLPRSILIWRAITQWLGGLGILLIILLVSQSQGSKALSLLNAEGVKVSSGRLSLNFRHATTRFTVIYIVLTLSQILLTN
jgi:trk system potassium uptake protein TrkH